jgi:phosphoserine aminotransferase
MNTVYALLFLLNGTTQMIDVPNVPHIIMASTEVQCDAEARWVNAQLDIAKAGRVVCVPVVIKAALPHGDAK